MAGSHLQALRCPWCPHSY